MLNQTGPKIQTGLKWKEKNKDSLAVELVNTPITGQQ